METVIDVKGLKNCLSGLWVHDDLDLTVKKGEKVVIVGGSGTGKTTLLQCILQLRKPTAGHVSVFGVDLATCSEKQLRHLQRRWGVLFQQSALFSSLTVLENVLFPLQEFTDLPKKFLKELALLKILQVGLSKEAAQKYPSQLSGGMQKRAAIARAIALDPPLLLLDEPTSGLDPKSAADFDALILSTHKALGATIVIISHDLTSIERTADKVAFIGEGKVLAFDTLAALKAHTHPIVRAYFHPEDRT